MVLKEARILGVGVLNYETTRGALETVCQQGNIELIASVEYQFKPQLWRRPIDILDFYDCLNAAYDLLKCPAVGADLLDQLSLCEVTYLKMIERLDYRNEWSYDKRKYHYLKQVTFWSDFIDRRKPTHAVFFNFPHEMYDYVIYNICKIKNVKTLIFDDFSILPDTLFLIETIEESCPEIEVWHNRLKAAGTVPKLTKLEKYYSDFKGEKLNETPAAIQNQIKQKKNKESLLGKLAYAASRIPDVYKNPSLILDRDFGARYKYSMVMRERKLFRVYNRFAVRHPALDCKFIYLALHYQPECSSSPMGGRFVEQHLIADMIAKNLPKGYRLYVKDHPLQKKHGRSEVLYEHIAALPNTYLIDREFSSFDLIENSMAVATMTGTAGWEGFLKGKPVLKFGNSFYQFAPGVFKIRTVRDVREALCQIEQGINITEADQKRYLEALEKASIDGWVLDFIKKPMTCIRTEDVIENIAKALYEKIGNNGVG